MFERFFKPKWQHPRAEIRRQTLERLDPDDAAQRAIIETLALEDPDPAVRRAALGRLSDPAIVGRIASSDSDPETAAAARLHLARIVAAEAPERVAEIARRGGPTVLDYLLEEGDETTRRAALDQIDDPHRLVELALRHRQSAVRLMAAERIDRIEPLQRLAREARGHDKRVYRLARQRLQQLRQEAERHHRHLCQCQTLCDQMEQLARADFSNLYHPRYRGLLRQWQQLEEPPPPELARRFETARQRCHETLERHQRELERLEVRALAQQRIDNCVQALEGQLDRLAASPPNADTPAALRRLLEEQRLQWRECCEAGGAEAEQQQRFERACRTLENLLAAWQRLQAQEEALTALAGEALGLAIPDHGPRLAPLRRELADTLGRIDWPTPLAPPAPVERGRAALHHLETCQQELAHWQREQEPRLPRLLDQLEAAVEAGQLRRAEGLEGQVRHLLERLPEPRARQYRRRFAPLRARVRELRDWRGFACQQKRQALCQQMEALAENPLPPGEQERQIKALRQEWRALGPPRPRQEDGDALRQRFDTAAERAWQPCREHHRQEAERRRANLAERERICRELEHYLETTDWEAIDDWHAVERIISTARDEWRRHGPVERKAGRPLGRRFHQLLEQLRHHLGEAHQRHAHCKERLIEQAETLAACEDGALEQAIDQIKALQRHWRDCGPLPRPRERQLWRRFRAACDALFERRDVLRQDRQQAARRSREEGEALCQKMEALASQIPLPSDHARQARHLEQQFEALGRLPGPLARRFSQARRHYREAIERQHQQARGQELLALLDHDAELAQLERARQAGEAPPLPEPETLPHPALRQRLERLERDGKLTPEAAAEALEARRRICVRAEIAAAIESPPEARELRMEEQLRLINQNRGHATELPPPERWIGELIDQWLALPAPDPAESLDARMRAAVERIFSPDS